MNVDKYDSQIDKILDDYRANVVAWDADRGIKRIEAKQQLQKVLIEVDNNGRNNSLLDLEEWIKLHNLGTEMILDGIEHMVKSNLQVPDQRHIDHSERIKALSEATDSSDGQA